MRFLAFHVCNAKCIPDTNYKQVLSLQGKPYDNLGRLRKAVHSFYAIYWLCYCVLFKHFGCVECFDDMVTLYLHCEGLRSLTRTCSEPFRGLGSRADLFSKRLYTFTLVDYYPHSLWIPISYLHVISSENDFCIRTSEYQWSQGFGFECLGGLINENVGKEAMKHLKVQKHFRCAQSGDNHSTFKNILTSRQQEYTVFDQAVIPRNLWCCLQSTWNLQNWKRM